MDTHLAEWLIRFLKGTLIGTGVILPGVSGGALAAVFGIYERIISFLANIKKDFLQNIMYFLPVAIGGATGIFVLSFVLGYLFETAETQMFWFFIGCIAGTLPALFRQAGKDGRSFWHIILTALTTAAAVFLLRGMSQTLSGPLAFSTGTWLAAGALIGLGLIIPGLSPSNFLVFLNMYKPMTDSIKNMDIPVILAISAGVAITALSLSRLINYILNRAYAVFFHIILGVVIASTAIIIPLKADYSLLGAAISAGVLALGVLLGSWMCTLEDKYK